MIQMSGFLGFGDSDHYYEGNNTMTIRDRIFARISELEITQKEFAKRTGIPETTVSDWKKKKTNPTAEKILVICKVLDVTPYELLGGTDSVGRRSNPSQTILIEKDSELGEFLSDYMTLNKNMQGRLIGYMKALKEYGENE